MPWRSELAALVAARHGGQLGSIQDRLLDLAQRHPNIAEIHHQLAWTYDILDRAAEALPHYERAIALGLPPNELSGALLGLGSTLRELGVLDRSSEVLRSGQAQFPENREFDVFLALTLHAQANYGEAMKILVTTLSETSDDVGITAYQRALKHWVRRH